MRRIAIQMDPLPGLNVATDSTIALAEAALARGYEVSYYHPRSLALGTTDGLTAELATLKLQLNEPVWWRSAPQGRQALDGFDAILMRQDPPFDMEYITATYLLETLAHKVFNHPAAVRNAPEKLSPFAFPAHQPPTLVSADAAAIRAFHAQHPDMVLKPLHGFGGHGVFRLRPGDGNREALLEMLLSSPKPEPLVAQAYLPAVKDRELRVLLIDGTIAASIQRAPQGNDIRSNLRVGGTAHAVELTAQETALATEVGAWARAQGLVLVGLDLIGGTIGEINVTCPTTLRTAHALYGTNLADTVWDAIGARCGW